MEAEFIINRMSEEDSNWFRQNSYDIARRDRNTAIANSKKRGLEQGLKQGLKKGIQQGIQQGLQQGLQQGIQQGIQQGSLNAKIEGAINLLKMKILSPEQIAQAQNLPLEKVLELQKNIAVEV